MNNFVGINIDEKKQLFFCDVGDVKLKKGITIIVSNDKNLYFAKVVKEDVAINNSSVYKFVRIAKKKDYRIYKNNRIESSKALQNCKKLVKKYNLNMNIISCEYTFNRNQLVFSFTSDLRIDFRDLVKDLADIYKTRIELRQIGVRDKAREIGGCGQCGRSLCCKNFLKDLDSVSINMAKNQNIALNPNKVNGVCGRLLCCLKYEDDNYTKCRKILPCLGTVANTDDGPGKVISVNLLKRSYKVDVPNKGIVECIIEDESSK